MNKIIGLAGACLLAIISECKADLTACSNSPASITTSAALPLTNTITTPLPPFLSGKPTTTNAKPSTTATNVQASPFAPFISTNPASSGTAGTKVSHFSPFAANKGHKSPLDFGWEFASAISSEAIDLSDRNQARQKIALAYLDKNDVETARLCTAEIEDWNKGIALTKIAEWLISHGQTDKAEAMLPEIVTCGFVAKGWERDWLLTSITHLQALLGKETDVATNAAKFAFHSNLAGDAAANLALMLSRTGRVDEARLILDDLAKTNNLDIANSRVKGYLELVMSGKLNENTATQIIINAWDATMQVKPYRRWELQLQVIDAMATNKLASEANSCLGEVVSNVMAAAKLPPEIRSELLGQAAISWKRLGDPGKAAQALEEAGKGIGDTLEVIFQPAAYARLASVYASSGEITEARKLFNQALDISNGLQNLRPRALAGVEVCLALSTHQNAMDADTRKGLERMLSSFKNTK